MDDLKISFYGEREINVYENKGTVVCRMEGFFDNLKYVGYGVARCKEGDTFDVDKGTRIATARAENSVYRQVLRDAKTCVLFHGAVYDMYARFIQKANNTLDHNAEYIKRVDEGKITSRKK